MFELRKEVKTDHRQQQLHHKTFDEFSRVKEQVAKTGRDHLPESFDLKLFENPVYRPSLKSKWLTLKGIDTYSGVHGAQVKYRHAGAGRESVAIAYSVGEEPFSLSYPQTASNTIQRSRQKHKETSKTQFDATCRTANSIEDKIKVNSLGMIEGL